MADEDSDSSGYEESGHEAEKNMFPRVPFHQVERFHNRRVKPWLSKGKVEARKKDRCDEHKFLPFFLPVHRAFLLAGEIAG